MNIEMGTNQWSSKSPWKTALTDLWELQKHKKEEQTAEKTVHNFQYTKSLRSQLHTLHKYITQVLKLTCFRKNYSIWVLASDWAVQPCQTLLL